MPPIGHPLLVSAALATVAVVSASFLAISRSALLKRRLTPLLLALNATCALVLALTMEPSEGTVLVGATGVVVAVLVLLALRATRHCDGCGRTIVPRSLQRRECPHCGDDLRAQAGARATGMARVPMRRARQA